MGLVSTTYYIDGKKFIEPLEWQELKEVLIYGKGQVEATIQTERFTFTNNALQYIYEKFNNKEILKPLSFEVHERQRNETIVFFKDYIIDLTDNLQFNFPKFGEIDYPESVNVTIRKKNNSLTFSNELQGVSFGWLESAGYINESNYSTVKTCIISPQNGRDIVLALIQLSNLTLTLINLVKEIDSLVSDISQRLASSPTSAPSAIVYSIVVTALRVANAIVIAGLTFKTSVDIITMILPPVLKNKGITWRQGLEAILRAINDNFTNNITYECDFDELDVEVLMPSKPHTNSEGIIEKNFPKLVANKKGIPHPNDAHYFASGFMAELVKRFNAVIYFEDDVLTIKTKGDDSLFSLSSFVPREKVNLPIAKPNIDEIPNTRLITFQVDSNDAWTTENYKGTSYEVKNKSKYTSFKGLERIDLGFSLGNVKTKTNIIEKLLIEIASVVDSIGKLAGKPTKLKSKIKTNRVNILKVSQHDISVPKLIPVDGNGNMLSNDREITSARAIENKYYVNESIVRGTGQKLIYDNVPMTFNLQDRNKISNKGAFINAFGDKSMFRSLDWTFSSDIAIASYEINNDYIASNDIVEELIEPE